MLVKRIVENGRPMLLGGEVMLKTLTYDELMVKVEVIDAEQRAMKERADRIEKALVDMVERERKALERMTNDHD